MIFNPDDTVEVLRSKVGYAGRGVVICDAYGGHYLVRVEIDGRVRPIIVRFQDLRKSDNQKKQRRKREVE